jgi:hypothetical protein
VEEISASRCCNEIFTEGTNLNYNTRIPPTWFPPTSVSELKKKKKMISFAVEMIRLHFLGTAGTIFENMN